jgi:hypothetical protein
MTEAQAKRTTQEAREHVWRAKPKHNFPAEAVFYQAGRASGIRALAGWPHRECEDKQMKRAWLKSSILPVAILFAGAALPVMAQSTTTSSQSTTTSTTDPNTIRDRRENQQDRIAQGVASGQLTPGETAKIEDQEAAVNGEIAADRKANDGKLTQPEKQQINQQQNQLSKEIYTDKHNSASDHFGNSEVGQRQENQQDRIAQGIKSGQLTAGQTANLESKEAALNQQVKADRHANDGKLTGAEKKQVNQEQNGLSKQIYKDKHSGRKGR